jgi:hypothetical protein
MPIILATQEAEIRRISFKASQGKWFKRDYLKNKIAKNNWWSGSRCRP